MTDRPARKQLLDILFVESEINPFRTSKSIYTRKWPSRFDFKGKKSTGNKISVFHLIIYGLGCNVTLNRQILLKFSITSSLDLSVFKHHENQSHSQANSDCDLGAENETQS